MAKTFWTPTEDKLLFALRAEGKTWPECSAILGKSNNACASRYGWANRLNGMPGRKMRRCLGDGCGEMFMSQHAGHRKCKKCRESEVTAHAFTYSYQVAL